MPYQPYPPPKKSLGIFGGLSELLDTREQRRLADEDRQVKLEDRVFGSIRQAKQDMQNDELLEERLKAMRAPKPARLQMVGEDLWNVDDPTKPQIVVDGQPKTAKLPDPYGGRTREQWLKDQHDASVATRAPKEDAASKPPAPAEFEKKAAFMLEGAKSAAATLDTYSPTPRTFINKIPGAGNYGLKESDQVALNAAETLHDAYLRLTTGATVTPDELRRAAMQYVPTPGDGPQVLAKKKERRGQILRALEAAASSVHRPGEQKAPGVVPPKSGVLTFEEWKAKRGGG